MPETSATSSTPNTTRPGWALQRARKPGRRGLYKLLYAAGGVAAACLIYLLAANWAVLGSTAAYRLPADAEVDHAADCIIVPGCRVSNGQPSTMLRARLVQGARLYASGAANKVLLSGDNGRVDYNELIVMLRVMVELGVPEQDIFLDYAGFSTYETARRARDVFSVRSAIVVTQAFHLPRAVYDLRQLGIDAVGVVTDDAGIYARPLLLRNQLREVFGRAKDWLYAGLIQPLPTYLGQPYDISGDGRVTHPAGWQPG